MPVDGGLVLRVMNIVGLVAAGLAAFFLAARLLRCEELASAKDLSGPILRRLGMTRKNRR